MSQNTAAQNGNAENTIKVKKIICIWSVASLFVSAAAVIAYMLVVGPKIRELIPVWEVLGIVSVFLPAVAKKIRIAKEQSGKGFETAAIVLGGFAFYSVIWLMTKMPSYVGFLGWIIGGLIYKYCGRENE